MRTSRSQVQVWISRRRADNNGLKYQNGGGGIIKKERKKNVHKNSYTGPEFLRAHHVTDEPDSGKTAAVVDGAAEEMKRQRVRGRDTGTTYFPMKSVCDLSAEDDELHSLAAAASSMAPEIPFTERTQRLHQKKVRARRDVRTRSGVDRSHRRNFY